MLNVKEIDTPLGSVFLGADSKGIAFLSFDECQTTKSNTLLDKAAIQLKEYFEGKRKEFDLELSFSGTAFELESWNALMQIPYGKIISYKEQAGLLGDTKKARAIGLANGKNPLPIIIPCHRVVRSDGQLGGYSCGIEKKNFLLDLEKKGLD